MGTFNTRGAWLALLIAFGFTTFVGAQKQTQNDLVVDQHAEESTPGGDGRGLGPVFDNPKPNDVSALRAWYPYAALPPFGDPALQDAVDVIYPGNARFSIGNEPAIPADLEIELDHEADFHPGYYVVHFRNGVDEDAHELLDSLTDETIGPDGRVRARWYIPQPSLGRVRRGLGYVRRVGHRYKR